MSAIAAIGRRETRECRSTHTVLVAHLGFEVISPPSVHCRCLVARVAISSTGNSPRTPTSQSQERSAAVIIVVARLGALSQQSEIDRVLEASRGDGTLFDWYRKATLRLFCMFNF